MFECNQTSVKAFQQNGVSVKSKQILWINLDHSVVYVAMDTLPSYDQVISKVIKFVFK